MFVMLRCGRQDRTSCPPVWSIQTGACYEQGPTKQAKELPDSNGAWKVIGLQESLLGVESGVPSLVSLEGHPP